MSVSLSKTSLESKHPQREAVYEFDIKFKSPCYLDVIEPLSPEIPSILYTIAKTGLITQQVVYQQLYESYGCPTQYGFSVSIDGVEQSSHRHLSSDTGKQSWQDQFQFDQETGSITINVENNDLMLADKEVIVMLFKESIESEQEPGRASSYEIPIEFISPCPLDVISTQEQDDLLASFQYEI